MKTLLCRGSSSVNSATGRRRSSIHKNKVDLDFEMEQEYEQDPDLFKLIHHKPWIPEERAMYDDDAVYRYANQHPKSFRARYDLSRGGFEKGGRGTSSRFPLLRILALGASLRTTEAVVRAYPPAVFGGRDKNTALHSACAYPSEFQVSIIEYLLALDPTAISKTNQHAYLPIHNACSAKIPSPVSLEAVKILVEAYPQCVSKTTKLGETPLQAAKKNDKTLPDVLSYLFQRRRGV